MADQLTDLSGIGEKTAEKLRKEGIDSPEELGERYRQNSPSVTNKGKRVRSAARDALFQERNGFTDPVSGAEVTEDNRAAFEKIAAREVSEFGSIGVSAQNPKVSPDDEVRKFIEPVREGRFLTDTGGDANLLGFAADAADNLGVDTLSSGELQDVNRAAQETSKDVMLREQSSSGASTNAKGTVTASEYIKAVNQHQNRSREARRVDNRREAERTKDYDQWKNEPDNFDMPGVDTPGGASQFFPEERTKRKRGGFGSSTRRNKDREKIRSAFDTATDLNDEQQERVFGESLEVQDPFTTDRV
jgi:hypothetical protein